VQQKHTLKHWEICANLLRVSVVRRRSYFRKLLLMKYLDVRGFEPLVRFWVQRLERRAAPVCGPVFIGGARLEVEVSHARSLDRRPALDRSPLESKDFSLRGMLSKLLGGGVRFQVKQASNHSLACGLLKSSTDGNSIRGGQSCRVIVRIGCTASLSKEGTTSQS
jgi:hypothetical protein